MTNLYLMLEQIRDSLAPAFDTSKIGGETGISSKDTPAVRTILLTRKSQDSGFETGQLRIDILVDTKNDLEEMYSLSLDLEEEARRLLKVVKNINYVKTVYDGDQTKVFKVTQLFFDYQIRTAVIECDPLAPRMP